MGSARCWWQNLCKRFFFPFQNRPSLHRGSTAECRWLQLRAGPDSRATFFFFGPGYLGCVELSAVVAVV